MIPAVSASAKCPFCDGTGFRPLRRLTSMYACGYVDEVTKCVCHGGAPVPLPHPDFKMASAGGDR